MRFILNRDKLKELARFRGWGSIYTALSEEMGFSASYCRRVVLGHDKLTDYFMLKYIKIAGCNPNKSSEWASLFVPILDGKIPEDHSTAMNRLKIDGMGKKYRWASPSFYFRKGDDPRLEVESLSESLIAPGRNGQI